MRIQKKMEKTTVWVININKQAVQHAMCNMNEKESELGWMMGVGTCSGQGMKQD